MAEEDKSFAALVAEAPPAPTEGVVSLVGTLARSSEHGKFVLILQDGRTITLETAAVKGHAVLGASLGRTIVRVDVDVGKVPASGPQPFAQATVAAQDIQTGAVDHTGFHDVGQTEPGVDQITVAFLDHGFGTGLYDTSPLLEKSPISDAFPAQAGGITPFALATPHQAPANVLDALNPFGIVSHMRKIPGSDTNAYRDYIDTGGGIDVIVLRTPY
jgi:hypothetical protein